MALEGLVQAPSPPKAPTEQIQYLVLLHLLAVVVVVRVQLYLERLGVAAVAVLFLRLVVRHHLRHKELLVVLAHLIKAAEAAVQLERG